MSSWCYRCRVLLPQMRQEATFRHSPKPTNEALSTQTRHRREDKACCEHHANTRDAQTTICTSHGTTSKPHKTLRPPQKHNANRAIVCRRHGDIRETFVGCWGTRPRTDVGHFEVPLSMLLSLLVPVLLLVLLLLPGILLLRLGCWQLPAGNGLLATASCCWSW